MPFLRYHPVLSFKLSGIRIMDILTINQSEYGMWNQLMLIHLEQKVDSSSQFQGPIGIHIPTLIHKHNQCLWE